MPPGEPADGAMTFLAGDTVLIVEQATGSTARTQPPICTGRFDFFAPEWKACQRRWRGGERSSILWDRFDSIGPTGAAHRVRAVYYRLRRISDMDALLTG